MCVREGRGEGKHGTDIVDIIKEYNIYNIYGDMCLKYW